MLLDNRRYTVANHSNAEGSSEYAELSRPVTFLKMQRFLQGLAAHQW